MIACKYLNACECFLCWAQAKHNPSGYKEPQNISISFKHEETSSKSLGQHLAIEIGFEAEWSKHNPSGYKEPKNISTSFRNKETSSKSLGHWLDIDLCWNLELGLSSVDGNSFPVESPWKEKSSRDHFCRPSRGAVLDTKIVTWRFSHCSREQTPERFIAVVAKNRHLRLRALAIDAIHV